MEEIAQDKNQEIEVSKEEIKEEEKKGNEKVRVMISTIGSSKTNAVPFNS